MAHSVPAKRKTNNNNFQDNNIGDNNNDIDEFAGSRDGGWGWIVVIASLLIHIITDGMTYSFGIMYVEFLNDFDEGKGYTSWILSILVGMTLCSGPISSSFVNKYGCRPVTISGSILAAGFLLCSMFAQNVLTLIITIGIGVGLGLGLIYLPAIVSVTTYFEKYRSVATGIAVAGSGLGTFIFAPLIDYFISEYGWRGTLLILSGIVLNCAIFGALFRPLTPDPPQVVEVTELTTCEASVMNDALLTYNSNQKNGQTQSFSNKRRHRNTSVRVPSVNIISEAGEGQMIRSQSVGHNMATNSSCSSNNLLNINYNSGRNEKAGSLSQKIGKMDGMRYTLSQPLLVNNSSDSEHESKPLKDHHKHWRSGTLSRPDIFYQGSLCNIPNYKSHGELPTDFDKYGSFRRISENGPTHSEPSCGCIPSETQENFIEMMNFSLFKDPVFILFTLSNFATSLGFNVPYVYLADQAKILNLSKEQGSYLLAIIGIANTFGRIILGYLSDKSWVNRLWVYNVCLTICGFATACSVVATDFPSLAVYAVVFGFMIGAYVGLTSVILVDLLGLEKLTNAFGLLLLFQGIASFIGPPIVGLLYDLNHSYTPGFIFAGSMIALSGLMLFVIPSLQKYLNQRRLSNEINNTIQAALS